MPLFSYILLVYYIAPILWQDRDSVAFFEMKIALPNVIWLISLVEFALGLYMSRKSGWKFPQMEISKSNFLLPGPFLDIAIYLCLGYWFVGLVELGCISESACKSQTASWIMELDL